MDYGALVRGAWALTWRYRFLWILGFFAGSAAGIPSLGNNAQYRFGPGDVGQMGPGAEQAAANVTTWASANIGLIVAVVALLVLLGLAMLFLSLVAQGGMARATEELATGHEFTLRRAWATGLHLFWRYLGLWLLLIAAAIVIAAVVGGIVAAIVATAPQDAAAAWIVAAVVIGIPLALAAIAAGIVVNIVVEYALRAIALEDVGPVVALRDGWATFRGHVGDSLLTWLVSIVLHVLVGIAIAAAAAILVAILVAVGAGIWSIAGFGVATYVYAAIAAVALIALGVTVAGAVNTFFWNFWTIVYLRFTGHGSEIVAA